MKKLLSWILVITLLTGLIPTGAAAIMPEASDHVSHEHTEIADALLAERPESGAQTLALTETISGYCGGEGDGTNLTWTLTPIGTLTITGEGAMQGYSQKQYAPWHDYTVSELVISDGVTTLGIFAFQDCDITQVEIPDSVISIGISAFSYCSNLTDLVIPDGVETIGSSAFEYCTSLTKIVIPDSVTSLGSSAFFNCTALKTAVIGDGVDTINNSLFCFCSSMERIEIGAGVTNMDFDYVNNSIFYGCVSLTEIVVDENCPLLRSIDGVLFDKAAEILLCYPTARYADTYTVPGSVKTIAERAFESACALNHIVIGDTVETIEYGAFIYSTLESATIGATTTERNAFHSCTNLKTVTFTSGARNIGPAFMFSGLQEVTIPSSVQSTDESFIHCDYLTKATIDCSTISDGTFAYNLALTDLTIGENVRSIGNQAFAGCTALTHVTIPGTVQYIDYGAFMDCTSLEIVTLKDGCTGIGYSMFSGCTALHTVNIPDTLTAINTDAFFSCVSLREIYIPLAVDTIGDSAFSGCTNLAAVIYPGTEAQWKNISIGQSNDPLWNAIGYTPSTGNGSTCDPPEGMDPTGICPEFTFFDLKDTPIFESSFSASTRLIVFFRTTCANSQLVIQTLADSDLADRYDLVILAAEISGANFETVADFADTYGNGGENILFCSDRSGYWSVFSSAAGNDGNTLPFIYVVDSEGIIRNFSSSYVTITEIENMLSDVCQPTFQTEEATHSLELYRDMTFVDPRIFLWNEAKIRSDSGVTTDEELAYIREIALTVTEQWTEPANQITAVAEYLAQNICYDYDFLEERTDSTNLTAYDVLTGGYAADTGYATVFLTMMQLLGIPCVRVIASDSEYNMVYNGGRWMLVDVARISKSELRNGSKTLSEDVDQDWYDFSIQHANTGTSHTITALPYMSPGGVLTAFPTYTTATSFVIPEHVTGIAASAFSGYQNLTTITIHTGVTSIGENAFSGCDNLTTVHYRGSEEQWNAIRIAEGNLALTNAEIVLRTIELPEIPEDAVDSGSCGKDLYWFLTSDGVLTIAGEGAMQNYDNANTPWSDYVHSISKVVVCSGVTAIGYGAFYNCYLLTEVELPNTLEAICDAAFAYCMYLSAIDIPSSVTSMGEGIFDCCYTLTSVTLPDFLAELPSRLFANCAQLSNIVIPDSVTTIGFDAFAGCSALTELAIPDGVTEIGSRAFLACTSLTGMVIPDGVETISYSTFDGCLKLKSITIPVSVTLIEVNAFAYCPSLETVYYGGSNGQWDLISIYTGNSYLTSAEIICSATISGSCNETITWELTPDGTLTIRGTGEMTFSDVVAPWSDHREYISTVIVEEGITTIEDFAFYSTSNLISVSLPDGLIRIGDFAFYGCSTLTSITLPDSVTSIGSQVFDNCTALSNITLSAGLTEIPNCAFWRCYSLVTIVLPANITTISTEAFSDCSSLSSITMGEQVTSIEYRAFAGCANLTSVHYAGTQAQWNAIRIHQSNTYLLNAAITYESTHVHTPETIPAVPGTCLEGGISEGSKCSACGAMLVEPTETPPLGHYYDDGTIEIPSGCEEPGLVRYFCRREGCSYSYTNETPPHGHKEQLISGKQPTATEPGLTPGKKCSICGKILVEQEEIPPVAPGATGSISEVYLGTLELIGNEETRASSLQRWASPITSYLIENEDGTISILRASTEYGQDTVLRLDTYSQTLTLLETKEIPCELSLFGGFFAGETYFYFVFGQTNMEEDAIREVIRLVKYDKNFNRLGQIAVSDVYTTIPFNAGSLRMAENGNELIVHTARQRYRTEDGLYHQSQLTIFFDTESMTVTSYNLGAFQPNHVSHSFNQFVVYDGYTAVLLDHGDAYPRSVVLHKENSSGELRSYNLFIIPGATGANCTGVTIEGFDQSDTAYLTAINTIDHSLAEEYTSFTISFIDGVLYEERDAVLLVTNKETMKTEQVYLTDYVGTRATASAPRLVNIGHDRFLVLWGVYSYDTKEQGISYVVVDGNGQRLSQIYHQADVMLSDCQPIVWNGTVIWVVDDDDAGYSATSNRILYRLDLSDLSDDISHVSETFPGYAPTCTESGRTDGTRCAECGKILTEGTEIPALEHDYDDGTVTAAPTCTEVGSKTITCLREGCGHTDLEEIPALGHTKEIIPGKEATLTEDGLTEGITCSVCGVILTEQQVIPMLTHIDGTCGETLKWVLTNEGVLTISGEGAMENYASNTDPLSASRNSLLNARATKTAPWSAHSSLIVSIVIETGVTSIGDNAFALCTSLKVIEIPETVTVIGDNVFTGCETLETVVYGGSEEQWENITVGAGNDTLTEIEVETAIGLVGDVNGDEIIDVFDAIDLLSIIASGECDPSQFAVCDVNADGIIDVFDAIDLLSLIANQGA